MDTLNQSRIFAKVLLLVFMGGQLNAFSARQENPVSVICMVAETGVIIEEAHADMRRPPASMVKLLQMLLVSEGLDDGSWTPDTAITVSAHAQDMGGTQVYLEAGEVWPLRHLLRAIAVASANDAAMAIAEGLWGSEEAYLKAANDRLLSLGMKDSKFYSVHGLPPDGDTPFDQTTARDMLLLATHCIDIPGIMELTGQRELEFKPGKAVKYNTNKLLWQMDGCDGLKTGYIRAAGFCVTATAERNGIRLLCVVMGESSNRMRFSRAKEVLERGFAKVEKRAVIARGTSLVEKLPVVQGKPGAIELVAAEDIILSVREEDFENLQVELEYPQYLSAPLDAGQNVGELRVLHDNRILGRAPLMVHQAVALDGWRLSIEGGRARWIGLKQEPTLETGDALQEKREVPVMEEGG